MARTQVRTKVGLVTTTVGLAVLLAGPMATLGVGVPTVDTTTSQVTSTVQGAVQTTQQTVATTVTQVESTVQTTTQAAAPQPAAAPLAPAAAQKVAAAPKQVAPVKKRVAAPRGAVKRPTVVTGTARSAAAMTAPVRRTATRVATARSRTAAKPRTTTTSSAKTSRTAAAPATQCDVPLLALLPGGGELTALLTVACEAAGDLGLPARIGLATTSNGTDPSLGNVLGTTTTDKPAPARARSARPGAHGTAGSSSRPTASAASAARPAGTAALPLPTGADRAAGATTYVDTFKVANNSPAASASAHGAEASEHHHHGWFSGESTGSEVLIAIIIANLAILAGILLWRLAARWIVPRFA